MNVHNTPETKISEEKIECFLATHLQLISRIRQDFPFVEDCHIPLLLCRAYVEVWGMSAWWLSWSMVLRAEDADQDIAAAFNQQIQKHKFQGINTDYSIYGGNILCERGLVSYEDEYEQLKNTCLPYFNEAQQQYPHIKWIISVTVSDHSAAMAFKNDAFFTPGIIHLPDVDHEKIKNMCEQMITQHQAQKILEHLPNDLPQKDRSKI